MPWAFIALVFSFVFACIAALVIPVPWPRPHFGWLAFLFYIIYLMLSRALPS